MMSMTTWSVPEIASALLSLPITSLVLGVFVALVIEAWSSRPSRTADADRTDLRASHRLEIRGRHRDEVVLLGVVPLLIIAVTVTDVLVRSYVLDMSASIAPLRVATPLLAACLGIALVAAVIVLRGRVSAVPVPPTARRTWSSFSRRRDLIVAGALAVALVATTVLAGLVSSADADGRHTVLEIPVPNLPGVDPLRMHFYGWAYGLPTLLVVAALAAAVGALLHVNSGRPFIRPETTSAERTIRRHVASDAVQIAAAATALALAAAWRLVADANEVTGIVITGVNEGNPYDATWRYAELATIAGWGAPVLEIAAFALLVLVAIRTARRLPAAEPAAAPEHLRVLR